MRMLYDIVINLIELLVRCANSSDIIRVLPKEGKIRKFIEAQKCSTKKVLERTNCPANTVWVHVASMGEYCVARPLIQKLRKNGKYVVLTFFSPTGYDALTNATHKSKEADEILLLPLDTKRNAELFIDTVRPRKAVFIISEIWMNYLYWLKKCNIPTYLVSAKINDKSAATKWYGGMLRDALRLFTQIMVLDKMSENRLLKMGMRNVRRIGDPLFDNALTVAKQEYHNSVIESFCAGGKVFIAGSINDRKDLEIVCHLANHNRDCKFVFVPHEIYEESLNRIKYNLNGHCLLYSECDATTDFRNVQVLVIDFLGSLAKIYRFCDYAYVGGGFTPFLHSVIEPVVYGLPVTFGPNIYRKNTPQELIDLGVGEIVHSGKELDKWFKRIRDDEDRLERISRIATEYSISNSGATDEVFEYIQE